MADGTPWTGIGALVRRREDERLLTGQGRYSDDLSLPGQVYAVMLRSPHPHAAIERIDAAAARTSPGVLAVPAGVVAPGVLAVPAGVVAEATWVVVAVLPRNRLRTNFFFFFGGGGV